MYTRYAIYALPDGALGDFGAFWLGWDCRTAQYVQNSTEERLDLTKLTARPQKYGFHATIKAPFKLADSSSERALRADLETMATNLQPVPIPSLQVSQIGKFFALTAPTDTRAIGEIAARVVMDLDPHRAPLSEAELERRRSSRLTPQQGQYLHDWGYPHVLDAFRFHITLTGPVPDPNALKDAIQAAWSPLLQKPYTLDSLSLMGEAEDGMFHQIVRVPLSG